MANKNAITVLWIENKNLKAPSFLPDLSERGVLLTKISLNNLKELRNHDYDLVVLELDNNIADYYCLRDFHRNQDAIRPVIARVNRDDFELGISLIKAGASSVVPCDEQNHESWMEKIKKYSQKAENGEDHGSYVFADPSSRKLLALTQKVAKADVAVLLYGSTGTGKEVMAKVIHESSPRHSGPFIAFNCAAIPESLVEDMLFGHEKGSFTGATSSQPGLFEQAQGGTVFLDEIGEMPINLQVKLLRVLQEKRVTRLGSQKAIKLDIRIVAATNKDLKQAILSKNFREDLYFRLSAFKLTIPALKERPLDIIPLAELFLNQEPSEEHERFLSSEAKHQLANYAWPGNVRELQNVMIRAMVLSNDEVIAAEHLIFDDLAAEPEDNNVSYAEMQSTNTFEINRGNSHTQSGSSLSNVVRNSEYHTIMSALSNTRNRDQAAKMLGISTRTLRHKLQRLREDGMAVTRAYAR